MALSPYKNSNNSVNRSRSSSCSSPVRNRIVFHEIYSLGANTLVRSYSCDQVFDKDESGRTFQTTKIQVSSFITPDKKIGKKVERKPNAPRRLAVEFPANSPDNAMQRCKPSNKQQSILKTVLKKAMIFTLLTVASACAFYFYITNKENDNVWDLERTEYELKENVFGQDQAIEKINSVLKMVNNTKGFHIMIFTGGVGVGKTFSSSIISQNFPWSSNQLITYSEYFAANVNKLLKHKLSTVGCNLVIVDDLRVKTVGEVINLIALLNNNQKANQNLFVILIFQIHTEAERNEITESFKNIYFSVHHVPFKQLTKDVVEKCFNAEIQRQKVKISHAKLNKLVEDKMKHVDIIKGPPGCKGVADEIASFYKID